ncbi:MAG TPA: hypothetical protein VFJ45_09310 [bacterium]|nr:hypothetical protein [bacterium]
MVRSKQSPTPHHDAVRRTPVRHITVEVLGGKPVYEHEVEIVER